MNNPQTGDAISATQIIQNIIKHELALPADYGKDLNENVIPCLITRDQDIFLGDTDQLQITVGFVNSPKTISNNTYQDFSVTPPKEHQTLTRLENIQIDLQSRNNDARDKQPDVIMALGSLYSKMQQDKYQFKIFKVPGGFLNTGQAEGSSNINRFTIVIALHVWYNKVKDITDYYDSFPTEIKVERGGNVDTFASFNAEDDPET